MKQYNLEDRTLEFGREILRLCKRISVNHITKRIADQLVRSGTSVGSNYREANEGISKKDCVHRLRIARKECKETTYWLELLLDTDADQNCHITHLIDESKQLRNILSSIIVKLQ